MQRPRRAPLMGLAMGCALALAHGAAAAAAPSADATLVARAEQLALAGDPVATARAWEQVASARHGATTVPPLAAAARAYLQAGRPAEAVRLVPRLDAAGRLDPRSGPGAQRGVVEAEIALASGHSARALALLRGLGEPPPAGTEAAVLLIRGRAYCSDDQPLEGLRALLARERFVPAAALAWSRHQLWDALRLSSARGTALSPPRGADPVLVGWLELLRLTPPGAAAPPREQVTAWRNRYPLHPATALFADAMPDPAPAVATPVAPPTSVAATPLPAPPAAPTAPAAPAARANAQIALLLPLTGRLAEAGEALRDGFMAAYYGHSEATRPPVHIYDAATDPAASYRRAVEDGAGFIVGPLGKENVLAVRSVADGRVATLALNVLPEGEAVPAHFYQFALAPEDEARQVAERLLAEGRRTGVALVPSGEWGTRVLAAFQSAFSAGGGKLVTSLSYASSTTDFSDLLVPLLGFEDSQRRYRAVAGLVGAPLQFTPRRRDDLEFVFFAGQPVQGRLVRPQLKFHYAGDLPVVSISDIFEPNPGANQDLEGVAFVDMPWMTADSPSLTELRNSVSQLWPGSARHRGRLFAMGYDAWQIATRLGSNAPPIAEPLSGLTGRLTVDVGGHVRRALDWVAIGNDGQPQPLSAIATPP